MTAEENPGDRTRKARLRRLEEVFVPAPIYFVTANASNRRSIFAFPKIHSSFLEFARVGEGRGVFVGAYVLMPNHIHLFVVESGDDIDRMREIAEKLFIQNIAEPECSPTALAERFL